jgi:hypothetical protein
MPTDRQIEANQANAKFSSGPTSVAGKLKSSWNALDHGCCAGRILIKDGEQPEFEQLSSGLRKEINPTGETQEKLFADLLLAAWNERRCQKTEVKLMLSSTSDVDDPLLDPEIAKQLDRVALYARRYNAAFHRTLKALRQVQTEAAFRLAVLPIGNGMRGVNVDAQLGMADSIRIRTRMEAEIAKVTKAQAMAREAEMRAMLEAETNKVNKLASNYMLKNYDRLFGKNKANAGAAEESR